MSTQFYTDQQAPPSPAGPPPAGRPAVLVPHLCRGHRHGHGGGRRRVDPGPVELAFQPGPGHHRPVDLDVCPGQPGEPATPSNPATPSHPVTPVQPSASVMQLQRQLGQLNYYEGPVDGLMGPQTIAAVQDLQRQAGLPQTGQMNAATQAALASYLAHGNNQMGGNS